MVTVSWYKTNPRSRCVWQGGNSVGGGMDMGTGRVQLLVVSPNGTDLSTAGVEAPSLQRVVQFQGTPSVPVHHIALLGSNRRGTI